MAPKQAAPKRSTDLAEAIERQIIQRTWGRIHRLQVEVIDDRVVVHGCTQSYYSKQLALEGVLDVIDDSTRVELDIQVATVPRIAVNGRADRAIRPTGAAG